MCKSQFTFLPRPAALVRGCRWPGIAAAAALAVLAASGAAAAPATLELQLGGRVTQVEVTAPTGRREGAPAAVILAHGFTRSRATMAGHAVALAREGVWAVAPDLPYLVDSRDNALALRDLLEALRGGAAGTPLERFVLVGFSAGGLAAVLAADAPGVEGFIGLDPFDRPGGVGLEAARRLRVPAFLLRSPSAACNAYSIAEPWAAALPGLAEDRILADASHCDFEAPTDRICEFVCGPADPARQAAVRDFLLDAVRRILAAPRR